MRTFHVGGTGVARQDRSRMIETRSAGTVRPENVGRRRRRATATWW
ncbi:MAG: hypothetical protein R3B99_02765 [Polyangiales bacterium]